MEIELRGCSRLHARITERQCERNRLGYRSKGVEFPPHISCKGCPGLGIVEKTVSTEEVVSVAKTEETKEARPKRPYNRKPKAVEGAGGGAPTAPADQDIAKSLLSGLIPATAVAAHVVVLDFAGQEELLAKAQAATDDLQRDIFALLRALLDGKLFTNDQAVLEG